MRRNVASTGTDKLAALTLGLAEYTKITMQVDAAKPSEDLWRWLQDSQIEKDGLRSLKLTFLGSSGQPQGGYTYLDAFICAWRVPTLYASKSFQKHLYEEVEIVPGYLENRDW